MAEAPVLRMPRRLLSPEESFALEDDVLVQRTGRRERRWPVNQLRRLTLGVRRSPYAPAVRFARLTFVGRKIVVIVSAPGASDYAAFIRALALTIARQAPTARIQAHGGRLAGLLIGAACLLGAGALAMALAAVMAGLAPLGLDLAAWLAFFLILIFALTPWIGRLAAHPLDPEALPAALLQ